MKILAIPAMTEDYMGDCVLHGLLSSEHQVDHGTIPTESDLIPAERMYKKNIHAKGSLYGRGYTLYCNIEGDVPKPQKQKHIKEKIRDCYYDAILYLSAARTKYFLEDVLNNDFYSANRVAFIDGEDGPNFSFNSGNGISFKRELHPSNKDSALPISFAFPKEKIFSGDSGKPTDLCSVIPGKKETYIWSSESDYYKSIQESKFAITQKKAGWDCLRHYDILFNKCLPIFKNISNCPATILTNHRKDLYKKINNSDNFQKWEKQFNRPDYNDLLLELFDHAINHHTTEKLVDYVLSKLKL